MTCITANLRHQITGRTNNCVLKELVQSRSFFNNESEVWLTRISRLLSHVLNRHPYFVSYFSHRFHALFPKIDQKPKNRILDAVNGVLFSKTVSNKFITVQDVVSSMLLCCKSIPEFVA